jgi:excinuclease ABC subunit C
MGQADTGAPLGLVGPLPSAPGVYRFRDQRASVLYIGRAVNLRRRVASYWGGLSSRGHLAPMVSRIARVQALVCNSEHEAAWLERNLLERELPRWNRSAGGQEVPVYIRLDLRPRSSGLKVVHDARPSPAARYFGPYLGGLRVRLAVSALHRVLPVDYAADGLRGWNRDMARARGIGPSDRAALAEALTAVLERDAEAVAWFRAELVRRRDSAVAELAFERAARLQEEIRAAEWVTSEQKVTQATPVDFAVHGWAMQDGEAVKGEWGGRRGAGDGVLVSFAVEAGRLRTWRQRPCGRAVADPLVAATPPAWVPFAQRNAELAAQLDRARSPGGKPAEAFLT